MHTHIFETSLVIYTVFSESENMDWSEFFLEILPKKDGEVVTIKKESGKCDRGKRGDRQHSSN